MINKLDARDGIRNGKAMARAGLALTAAMVVVGLLLAPSSGASGLGSSMVLAQESPSPSATEPVPTGPSIAFLNPSVMPVTVGPPDTADPPVMADKPESPTQEESYDIVVWVASLADDAIVELAITPEPLGLPVGNEETIGLMTRVPGTSDTFEYSWDIPESMPEGPAVLVARAFEQRITGFEEVAAATIDVELSHNEEAPPTGNSIEEAHTYNFTWPTQGGPLGFYKSGQNWRAYVDAFSLGVNNGCCGPWQDTTNLFYTVTNPGLKPVWTQCAVPSPGTVRGTCVLLPTHTMSQVKALGSVIREDQNPAPAAASNTTLESGDAVRILPYEQTPELAIAPSNIADDFFLASPEERAPAGDECVAYILTATDAQYDRAVPGVNMDAHITGPSDQVQFASQSFLNDRDAGGANESAFRVPDSGHTSADNAYDCDDRAQDGSQAEDFGGNQNGRRTFGREGDHNRPGLSDTKHRETVVGSGLDGGAVGRGQWLFYMFSRDVGYTDIEAWLDDEALVSESGPRPADDDVREESEPGVTTRTQWLPEWPPVVSVDPPGLTALPGSCVPFTIKVRSGSVPVTDANVDIHASGPDDELDFCDPTEATPRNAPTLPETEGHEPEEPDEAFHLGASPRLQHTEAETDDQGNVVLGLVSGITGDTTITAWFDEEWDATADNNDEFEDSSGSEAASGTISWGATIEEAQVSFLNPSPYGLSAEGGGDGTTISAKQDQDTRYHIVTRTDAVSIPGMEILLKSGDEEFKKIGDAIQVSGSDTWDFFWNLSNVVDGSYTLRAQIAGTSRGEEIPITVNNAGPNPDPRVGDTTPPSETVEIFEPIDGQIIGFSRGEITIRGSASTGADIVDLFYTKVASKDTPTADDWILCGFANPAANGNFNSKCKLDASDQGSQVTGIAALAYDCFQEGCSGEPTEIPARDPGENDSGDAHRIFGIEANPAIALEPAEAQEAVAFCQRYELRVVDQTGNALGGENVDVHVSGPEGVRFCDAEGSTGRRAPADGAHVAGSDVDEGAHEDGTKHIETESGRSGRVIFGIISDEAGDSNLTAWIDRNDNDVVDDSEVQDSATMHWTKKSKAGRCTQTGTNGRDVLRGTSGRDKICAKKGNDVIRGLGGADILVGGGGNDRIFGNRGRDRLHGRTGKDKMKGGRGRDTCTGGRGRDRFASCNVARK